MKKSFTEQEAIGERKRNMEKCRFRHLTNEQLHAAQINQGMLIDRLCNSKKDKLQLGNARQRYWRILDEWTRRKADGNNPVTVVDLTEKLPEPLPVMTNWRER